jgi:nicotinamide-nucleotide amidase
MDELKTLMLGPPPWTLAVAESMTVGHVQARIGAISGASNFFLGGVTAYSLEQKVRHLKVDRLQAAAVNCVSAGVAEEMARGVGTLFGADVGLATTGYAEPSPPDGVVHPFSWWAIAFRPAARPTFLLRHGRIDCPDASRTAAQAMVADTVLKELTVFLREVRR